jgi:hypothetical protein
LNLHPAIIAVLCYLPAGAGDGVAEEVAGADVVTAFLACFFVCFLTGTAVAVESLAVACAAGAGVAELLAAGVWAKVKAAAAKISMSVFMAFFRSSLFGARFSFAPC